MEDEDYYLVVLYIVESPSTAMVDVAETTVSTDGEKIMYGEKSNRVMKNLEEVIQILKENDRILKERFKIKSIGVFGSVTKGEQKETSDVDVIVEFYEPVGWEIVDLKEFLEELLGVRVDVVTKRAAMRKSILWKSIEREIVYV